MMKTISAQAEISADGKLRLEVPCDLPAGLADVVVVVQPATPPPTTSGQQKSLYGMWKDKLPDADVEAEIRELRRQSAMHVTEFSSSLPIGWAQ
jgi:hypothetical protein